MPVQINEMIIRAKIIEGHEMEQEQRINKAGLNDISKDEIIKECAALVLEMLNEKNQR